MGWSAGRRRGQSAFRSAARPIGPARSERRGSLRFSTIWQVPRRARRPRRRRWRAKRGRTLSCPRFSQDKDKTSLNGKVKRPVTLTLLRGTGEKLIHRGIEGGRLLAVGEMARGSDFD